MLADLGADRPGGKVRTGSPRDDPTGTPTSAIDRARRRRQERWRAPANSSRHAAVAARQGGAMRVEDRVREQFPAVQLTLISVLVGLVLADLVMEMRSRMALWPLDAHTLRTWGQLGATLFAAIVAWCYYATLIVTGRRIPGMADTVIAFLVPLALLVVNGFVGEPDSSGWNLAASGYLLMAALTGHFQVRTIAAETGLFALDHMAGLTRSRLVLLTGMLIYGAAGLAAAAGRLPLWLDAVLALGGAPVALLHAHLAYGEWHRALAEIENE